MQDLGIIKRYLGITFEHTCQGIFLHQQSYTASILDEYGMSTCKHSSTPFPKGTVLITNMQSPPTDSTNYYCLIGKLIFLTITWHDIAVSRLSSYMSKPQEAHLEVAKNLLRYLQGTQDHGKLYHADAPLSISGFTDADWSAPQINGSLYIHLSRGPHFVAEQETNHHVEIIYGVGISSPKRRCPRS